MESEGNRKFRLEARRVFRGMSDRALAFQSARIPDNGNISRQELDRELARRLSAEKEAR